MNYRDRLYGPLDLPEWMLRLCQTPQMARLRDVSLSAGAARIIPTSVPASRFEHSVGAALLALICAESPEFAPLARNLAIALLTHDCGSPPFSHVSERYQKIVLGIRHEQASERALDGTDLASEIVRLGGSPDIVFKLITGDLKPFSDLVNGSIDLDNLDNTIRYGISNGVLPLTDGMPYDPRQLARSFRLVNSEIALVDADLDGWERCRHQTYEFVYGPENIASTATLLRILDFAYEEGKLDARFFESTDSEAIATLADPARGDRSASLMRRALLWNLPRQAYEWSGQQASGALRTLIALPDAHRQLSNELCAITKAKPDQLFGYAAKSKAHREIHLPLVTADGASRSRPEREKPLPPAWHIRIFLDEEAATPNNRQAIAEYIESTYL